MFYFIYYITCQLPTWGSQLSRRISLNPSQGPSATNIALWKFVLPWKMFWRLEVRKKKVRRDSSYIRFVFFVHLWLQFNTESRVSEQHNLDIIYLRVLRDFHKNPARAHFQYSPENQKIEFSQPELFPSELKNYQLSLTSIGVHIYFLVCVSYKLFFQGTKVN